MKKIITLLLVAMISTSSYAVINSQWKAMVESDPTVSALSPELINQGLENFLTITPKDYRVKTGKRLGIVNSIKLKMAQRYVKSKLKNSAGISEGIYILLAILGLGWLAMGILDDWKGQDWIIGLILSALFWLPGVIYALIKKSKYF